MGVPCAIDMVLRVFSWDCNAFNILAESVSELCVLADVKRTLNTNAAKDNVTAYTTMYSKFLHFSSIQFTKWNRSHIFQSCIFHPCIFGPAFSSPAFSTPAFSVLHFPVPHFPVLHFSTLEIWSYIFQSCRSLFDLSGPSLVPHFPVLHFQSTHMANVRSLSESDIITIISPMQSYTGWWQWSTCVLTTCPLSSVKRPGVEAEPDSD